MKNRKCKIYKCGKKHWAKGLCNSCYVNWQLNHKPKGRSIEWFAKYRAAKKMFEEQFNEE